MAPKILIIGGKGMAGHITTRFLRENTDWEIVSLDRAVFSVDSAGKWKDKLIGLNSERKFDYILNFIGVLKPQAIKNPVLAVKINSLFPHELAELCTGLKIKVIHITTDCWDDLDIYGRSKRAGELDYPEHLTIRTSIIGPELKSEGSGLFHWFMTQQGEVNGFTKHYWDGVTTLEFAKNILEILSQDQKTKNTIDIRTNEKISKFELVSHIKEVFGKNIKINPKDTEIVDKTNNSAEILCSTSLKEQIKELREWMIDHKDLYAQYFS